MFESLYQSIFGLIVRHAAAAAVPWLIALGLIMPTQANEISAAILTLAAVLWSAIDKFYFHRKIAALTPAIGAGAGIAQRKGSLP